MLVDVASRGERVDRNIPTMPVSYLRRDVRSYWILLGPGICCVHSPEQEACCTDEEAKEIGSKGAQPCTLELRHVGIRQLNSLYNDC